MSTGVAVSSMSSYAILGCGSVGHLVAEELAEQGKDVLIIDRDESRVEALRDQDLNAQEGDISEPSIVEAIAEYDIALIMSSDIESNKAAVENLREADADRFIVVRASDPVSSEELRKLGADVVINPPSVIADSALRSLEQGELEHLAQRLAAVLTDSDGDLAILTYENPDPDALASAVALQAIADHFEMDADIYYRGEMGHQENRAFVNLLGIELHELDPNQDLREDYGLVATIGHDSDEPITTDILFHHDPIEAEVSAQFVDVRSNMSSTSTILTKYVQEFDMSVDESVATALLYGVRSETLDFKRDTTPADLTAAAYLYPFADHETLEQVESPSMSPETLDVLSEAIRNREVQGSHLISNAGFVRARDALTQAAQQLLNLEGITTAAVFGIDDDTIYIEAHSKDIRMDIGSILQDAFSEVGETAGHTTKASAEIPLGIFTGLDPEDDDRETFLDLIEAAVRKKLFAAMGVDVSAGENGNNS